MILHVEADLTYRFDRAVEVLLLVEAARRPDQIVLSESLDVMPSTSLARLDDPVTGERRVVFAVEGQVSVAYRADVEVAARHDDLDGAEQSRVRDLPGDTLRYLRPSRYCPSDRFESFCRDEFGHLEGGMRVRAILDWIHRHVRYEAGVSDAATTALDTFVERAGVCRDFSHLAITLCRASDIPARAVSAHAWQLDPPDMHAVAEVYLGGEWRLVDATRKCPLRGLVRVATGLDAADIAFMTIFGDASLVSQRFSVEEAA